jgi:hypothetical protein
VPGPRSPLVTTSMFAIFGPAIGCICFVVFGNIAANRIHQNVSTPMDRWLSLVMVSYVIGLIPAAASGLACDLIIRRLSAARRLNTGLRFLIGAAVGASICAAPASLVRLWEVQLSLFAAFCSFGAIAGAILAVIFPTRRALDS